MWHTGSLYHGPVVCDLALPVCHRGLVPYCQHAQLHSCCEVAPVYGMYGHVHVATASPRVLALQWPPRLIELPKFLADLLLLRQVVLLFLSVAIMVAAHSKQIEHSILFTVPCSKEQDAHDCMHM